MLASDPRFHDNASRVANRTALDREIASVFDLLLRRDLTDRLRKGSIAYGAVNGVADLAAHPQLRRATVETEGGPIDLVAPAARTGPGPREPAATVSGSSSAPSRPGRGPGFGGIAAEPAGESTSA